MAQDGLLRQLSVDAAKGQLVYHSRSRAGNLAELQCQGPVVNAQTIPTRGTNAKGLCACQLHISVRRHYKEKGKQPTAPSQKYSLQSVLKLSLHLDT